MIRPIRLLLATILITAATSATADPKLYIFDCGWIGFEDVGAFGLTNDETTVRELFVPCYLIEHEKGRLLWDGGLPLALAGQPRRVQQPGVTVEYKRSLLDQLKDLDLTPDDIDLVAYSHFHFDHVGAANAFPNSRLLIQQTEYDAAFMNAAQYPIFEAALYDQLGDAPKTYLNGDYDVFGDGSVVIVSAPGHTPGHQTLLLDLDRTGRIMLSGDLYHFEFNRSHRRTPVFNTDPEETLRSMDKVEALLEETGAVLWIEHSLALAERLNLAPAFYD